LKKKRKNYFLSRLYLKIFITFQNELHLICKIGWIKKLATLFLKLFFFFKIIIKLEDSQLKLHILNEMRKRIFLNYFSLMFRILWTEKAGKVLFIGKKRFYDY
jgi:hypothetical protein